ncbi:MAG: transposase [Clostridia bacterium]
MNRGIEKQDSSDVTIVADTKAKRIIDAEEGRDGETVDLFSKQLENHGGDCNQIKCVTSDVSAAYGYGIQLYFPHATSVIDKFHGGKSCL